MNVTAIFLTSQIYVGLARVIEGVGAGGEVEVRGGAGNVVHQR